MPPKGESHDAGGAKSRALVVSCIVVAFVAIGIYIWNRSSRPD